MTNPEIVEWLNSAVNVPLNPDQAFGLQCVDACDAYAEAIFGVPWQQSIGGVTGAREILDSASDNYWIRTDNNPNDPNLIPKPGDVVVFGGNSVNQWGHVAIVDLSGANAEGMNVIQQDGFAHPLVWANGALYSNKPAHRAWLPYYGAGTGMVSGWLTPKEHKIVNYKGSPAAAKPAVVKANQRLVGPAGGNQRSEPNSSSAVVRSIPGGTLEEFTHYVYGQNIDGINLWYKDSMGFAWAGIFETQSTDGLENATPKPAVVAPKASQRLAGPNGGNQRAEANTGSAVVRAIPGGSLEEFTGYVRGQNVDGIDLWYRDSLGYAWAGIFEEQKTDGLPDLTPKAPVEILKNNERKIGSAGGKQRVQPNTEAEITAVLDPSFVFTVKGYVHGQKVDGNDIWFVGNNSGHYVWSGGTNNGSFAGLPNLSSELPPKPPVQGGEGGVMPVTPVAPGKPSAPSYKPEFACVTEYIPAHPDNYQVGNFPDKPAKAVVHQFGTLGVHTYGSTLTYFKMGLDDRNRDPSKKRVGESAAHFVISGKNIIQMVSVKNRAYHAGAGGNDFIGIETDPLQDADTIASTRKLLGELSAYYGKRLELMLHKKVDGAATQCGNSIDLKKYEGFDIPSDKTSNPVGDIAFLGSMLAQVNKLKSDIENQMKKEGK